jgi:hypothetical protein
MAFLAFLLALIDPIALTNINSMYPTFFLNSHCEDTGSGLVCRLGVWTCTLLTLRSGLEFLCTDQTRQCNITVTPGGPNYGDSYTDRGCVSPRIPEVVDLKQANRRYPILVMDQDCTAAGDDSFTCERVGWVCHIRRRHAGFSAQCEMGPDLCLILFDRSYTDLGCHNFSFRNKLTNPQAPVIRPLAGAVNSKIGDASLLVVLSIAISCVAIREWVDALTACWQTVSLFFLLEWIPVELVWFWVLACTIAEASLVVTAGLSERKPKNGSQAEILMCDAIQVPWLMAAAVLIPAGFYYKNLPGGVAQIFIVGADWICRKVLQRSPRGKDVSTHTS